MKSYLNKLTSAVVLIALLAAMTSCNFLKKNDKKIIGLWTLENNVNGVTSKEYIEFDQDGTFRMLCDNIGEGNPGYMVDGKWSVSLLTGALKLDYNLSTLRVYHPFDSEPDAVKVSEVLSNARKELRAIRDNDVELKFSGSGDEMTMIIPDSDAREYVKDTETDLEALSNQKEIVSVTEEEVQTVAEPVPVANSTVFHDGLNRLDGAFNFKGADYGFIVTFVYDTASGKASSPTYEATGYGSVSNLSNVYVSPDGSTLSLSGIASGTQTSIRVSYTGNSTFEGSMTRGANSGTCRMTLQ